MIAAPVARIAVISFLHPKMRPIAERIHQDLLDAHETNRLEFRFEIFETLRLPGRQAEMLAKGTSKAGPWQSAHAVGLAVDFVPYLTADQARVYTPKGGSPLPGWYWPRADHSDWDGLADIAEHYGMKTIAWDRPHVEHPLFDKIQAAGF
ncbi:endolysin protein [Rhizobium phage RHph_N39]|nr:endolysin protein [Rhizobium phage RHph_N39]